MFMNLCFWRLGKDILIRDRRFAFDVFAGSYYPLFAAHFERFSVGALSGLLHSCRAYEMG